MKISAIYVNLGFDINYADKAFESAVEIIVLEGNDSNGKSATNSVDVYNPWIAIARIFNIIQKGGDSAAVSALRESLRANAAQMIKITTAKTVKFKKEDGSFGYTQKYSPQNSQGAPVAVPNTVEGDVNGGTIALVGVTSNMLTALGITGLNIYAPSDLYVFLDRISERTHIEKAPPLNDPEDNLPVDFEESKVGNDLPARVTSSLTNGEVRIVEGGKDSTRALLFYTVSDKGDRIMLKTVAPSKTDSCYAFEFDMRFTDIKASSSTAMQISVGNMYMLTLGVTTAGKLTFGDSSGTNADSIKNSFDGSFDALEWHRIRIEHYRNDGAPVITAVYVDGTLVGTSNNYLGKHNGTWDAVRFDMASMYALFSTSFTVLLDNLHTESSSSIYGTNPDDGGEENVPTSGEKTDFENAPLGQPNIEGLSTKPNPEEGNSIEIKRDPLNESNQALCITAKPSTTAGNWVYKDVSKSTVGGIYTFDFDVYAHMLGKSSFAAQIFFYSDVKTVAAVDVTFYKADGGVRVTFDEKVSDNSKNEIFLRADDTLSGYLHIRMSYDSSTSSITVTLTAAEKQYTATTAAYYSEATKGLAVTRVAFYTLFGTDAVVYLDNIEATCLPSKKQ